MSLFARARGRHTRCSGWGGLGLMVAAYRAYPAREAAPMLVPLMRRPVPALAAKTTQENQ